MSKKISRKLFFGLIALSLTTTYPTLSSAKVDKALETTAILLNGSAVHDNQPIEVKFIEDKTVGIEQPKFVFNVDSEMVVMEVRYNPLVNNDIRRLLELTDLVNTVSKSKLNTPFQFLEIHSNAERGDLFAKQDLIAVRLFAKAKLRQAIESGLLYQYEDLSPKAEMDKKTQKLALKELNSEIEALIKERDLLLAKATKAERAQLKERELKNKSTGILDNYEAQEEKLNDLILKNDRKGVRKMLEAYLPFEVMNPIEKDFWKQWLEALEKPDAKQSVISFRGLDKENDKLQIAETKGKLRYGLMSTLLTRNQGSYTRRLRSLVTARKKIGLHEAEFNGQMIKSSGIIAAAKNHSADPAGSPFLSLTPSIDVASNFAEDGIAAFKIDKRRLFINIASTFETEREFLVPLIIFPDEVVSIKTWSATDSPDVKSERLTEFQSEVSTYRKEANRMIEIKTYQKMSIDALAPITNSLSTILCKGIL